MNHTLSKVKVYQTEDYKIFKMVDGNRPLNKKKIDRIIKEISSGNDILDEVPILVNEVNGHFEVLDGQHRLDICKQLKRPVHYIIHKKEMNLYQVAKVNSNVEKWTADDFIACYVKAGNNNYKQLQKFHKEYGIAIGTCLTLLTIGGIKNDFGSTQKLTLDFEQGLFEVKKYKEAVLLAEICRSFSAFAAWHTRPFVMAISKILFADKCEFDVLLKKFNSEPKRLLNHGNWRSYLTNLEEIYNTGNSKRRVIF